MKNIIAVIVGIIVGSIVNMSLIAINAAVIPLPEGADNSTMEKLKESIPLFEPKHFIFPFLAHAMGTFAGAFVTAKLAATRPMIFAYGIGAWFLLGGTMMVFMVGGPVWFITLDLIGAYLPMAWLGGLVATRNQALPA